MCFDLAIKKLPEAGFDPGPLQGVSINLNVCCLWRKRTGSAPPAEATRQEQDFQSSRKLQFGSGFLSFYGFADGWTDPWTQDSNKAG